VNPHFPTDGLKFLRALKRNNDREWFKARKDDYERHVRAPMIVVIEQLAHDFKRFAPELVASPKTSLYRIYRDTRFSSNKTPLKTNAAAVFPWRGLPRHEGAGLYFEVAPGWVWAGGGMYAPPPPQLLRVREHIAATWPEIRRIAKNRTFAARVGSVDGERLTRVPRGFPQITRRRSISIPSIPRGLRISSGARNPPGFLSDDPLNIQGRRPAHSVPERTVGWRQVNPEPLNLLNLLNHLNLLNLFFSIDSAPAYGPVTGTPMYSACSGFSLVSFTPR
jgi:uncharacterized protein (TIGR02453 family)